MSWRVGRTEYKLLEGTAVVTFHHTLDGRRTKTVELDAHDLVRLIEIAKAFRADQFAREATHANRARRITAAVTS